MMNRTISSPRNWDAALDRDKLCKWLELPVTPWPPDHYALLGLKLGQGNTDEIEQRVLDRMEKLRRYQLLHPEQVTDGMNLLAQAMIVLTDPRERRQYDTARGLSPTTDESDEEDEIPILEVVEEPESVAVPSRRTNDAETFSESPDTGKSADLEPKIVWYEPGDIPPEEVVVPEFADESPLAVAEEDDAHDFDEVGERPGRVNDLLPPNQQDEPKEYRRGLYRELVKIRRVTRIWERLRIYLDDPARAFTRRTETVAFMACLAELKPILPTIDLVGGPGQPGNLVAVLSRQQLVVEMFRSFLPSQKESLARDCREAHFILVEHYRQLREELARLTAKSFGRRFWRPLGRHLFGRPEWFFLAIGLAALAIAFVRSMPK